MNILLTFITGFSALVCVVGIAIALLFFVMWLWEAESDLASFVRWVLFGLSAIGASLIVGSMIMHIK